MPVGLVVLTTSRPPTRPVPFFLHPGAQSDFDAKADVLLAVARQRFAVARQRFEASPPSDEPSLVIAGLPVPVEVTWQSLQDTNIRTAVAFPIGQRVVRIEDDDFLPVVRLGEQIQQRRELSNAVSVEAVLDPAFCVVNRSWGSRPFLPSARRTGRAPAAARDQPPASQGRARPRNARAR